MYKKKFLFTKLLIFILLNILPITTYAEVGKIILECDNQIASPGDEITCNIKGKTTSYEVLAISSQINVSEGLILEEVVVDSIWEGDDEKNLELYTDINQKNIFPIATFKIKVSDIIKSNSTEKITIGLTKFYDSEFKENAIQDTNLDISVNSNETSTVNTLSSLTISDSSLKPNFDAGIENYTTSTTRDTVVIEAIATDTKATVTGDIGEVELKSGENTLKIDVISESGSIKTYTITIIKTESENNDNQDVVDSDQNPDQEFNEKEEFENPKTGSLQFMIVCGIMLSSSLVGIYYFSIYQKNNGGI